jgi:hypothetical protein
LMRCCPPSDFVIACRHATDAGVLGAWARTQLGVVGGFHS